MYVVKVDRLRATVDVVLEGKIEVDEMRHFDQELGEILQSLQGRKIRIKSDLRGLRPVAPEVAELLRRSQERAIECGVLKAAEIIDSELLALQLGRVARESGLDRVSRRFTTEAAAKEWLLEEG